MKDPKRVDKVINQIRGIWHNNPELRLGQLIMNCFDVGQDIYYIEDDKMIEEIKKVYVKNRP